jgi:hypothetical protein
MTALEEAYCDMVDTYITKQQTDSKDLCEYRIKLSIICMFLDIIPLIYNCDCVSDEEFLQMQNLIIKITGDTSLGIIDADDLICGGITTQVVHTVVVHTVTGSSALTSEWIQRGRISLTADVPYHVIFSSTLGTSGSSYMLVHDAWNSTTAEVGHTISDQTQNGFDVVAVENCVFHYLAILL